MKQTDSNFHNMYVRNFNFIWANSFLHEVLVVFGDRAQCEILSWGPKSPVAPLVWVTEENMGHGAEAQTRLKVRTRVSMVHAVCIAADMALTAWRFERWRASRRAKLQPWQLDTLGDGRDPGGGAVSLCLASWVIKQNKIHLIFTFHNCRC